MSPEAKAILVKSIIDGTAPTTAPTERWSPRELVIALTDDGFISKIGSDEFSWTHVSENKVPDTDIYNVVLGT